MTFVPKNLVWSPTFQEERIWEGSCRDRHSTCKPSPVLTEHAISGWQLELSPYSMGSKQMTHSCSGSIPEYHFFRAMNYQLASHNRTFIKHNRLSAHRDQWCLTRVLLTRFWKEQDNTEKRIKINGKRTRTSSIWLTWNNTKRECFLM